MKPSSQVQAPDAHSTDAAADDWTIVEIDRPLIDAILNTIRNLELEGQYLRLRPLFEERGGHDDKPRPK
jgi:hypothetical protein